ncbi:MAG: hypothetical protein JO254_13800, partial [Pseudolabrys sp.]|nr:hypothetical protein [Pseudolabrys sp.]
QLYRWIEGRDGLPPLTKRRIVKKARISAGDRNSVIARIMHSSERQVAEIEEKVDRMDKDLARQVIRVAFASGRELETLVAPLKAGCAAEEYKYWMRQVAMAIDGVQVALVNKAIAKFPDLEAEIEANLARTGLAMP